MKIKPNFISIPPEDPFKFDSIDLKDSIQNISTLLQKISREGANKRGNSSRLTQSFHFFMFEP
ncbi:hypothetical protein, partial [Aeromonas sp. D3]|uniref:hypothetical protein n=1 Tax=Aeromonas sp. D3 TaxID=2990474 RepID=UPI0022E4E19C